MALLYADLLVLFSEAPNLVDGLELMEQRLLELPQLSVLQPPMMVNGYLMVANIYTMTVLIMGIIMEIGKLT